MQNGPITKVQIEAKFEEASQEEIDKVFIHLPMNVFNDSEPLGLTLSKLNSHGVFTPDGQKIGSTCGCEDYPCCGH